jgi:glucosylceramidase
MRTINYSLRINLFFHLFFNFLTQHLLIKNKKIPLLLTTLICSFNSSEAKSRVTVNTTPRLIESWITTPDQKEKLNKQRFSILFNKIDSSITTSSNLRILIDSTQEYQTVDGFGYTLTGGSAKLLKQLNLEKRQKILNELFSKDNDQNIGVSFLRLSIGASDLSDHSFSYDDSINGRPDLKLTQFNLFAGDEDIIPILKEILKINPNIGIVASPWSAPAWMKDNGSFIGGSLKNEFYDTYAKYLVKYLLAMKFEGITIQGISPQNEPMNANNEPSMLMSAKEQALFIKKYLGPTLENEKLLKTKIISYDHNCDHPEYPIEIFEDAEAEPFVEGSAWHLYGGNISALSLIHTKYPNKKIYFTERWTSSRGEFSYDLGWHINHVIIGALRNWSQIVLEWNLAADPMQGPHTPSGCYLCLGALTINGSDIQKNVAYYIIAHASKFISAGSIRINSNSNDDLPNVAFKTTDSKIILIAYNPLSIEQKFIIDYHGHFALIQIKAGAVGTFIWSDFL